MAPETLQIAFNLGCAWLAGSLIGIERSFHGRSAGFRTHALVALASAAVMVIVAQPAVVHGLFTSRLVNLDPTPQLVQGVMTGVGFLGAGVIFKEGVSVQGLTTAACIWCTAAIGLLFGLALVAPGIMATGAVLVTLVVFRWIETWAPGQIYARAEFTFQAAAAPSQAGLLGLLNDHDVDFADMSYGLAQAGEIYRYSGMLRSRKRAAFDDLAKRLRDIPGLIEYDIERLSK
jgi:putative Mg2+ transporter-C (MgtC) family protein